jgi:uncharacterized protein YndB with AHSA1/START domain
MNSNLIFDFAVDEQNNTINVKREFAAPLEKVWAAWTQSDLLDQWWAPKPWTSKTKSMDFTVGGTWLYAMVGPDGTKQWCRADYKSIETQKSFSLTDAFCDADGKINDDFPRSSWENRFEENGGSTVVNMVLKYERLEDLEKIMEMGFKEGFTAGLGNLDELLASQA